MSAVRRCPPAILGAVALALWLTPAVARAVPPGGPAETPLGATVTLASTTVAPGATVTVSGAGYDPGEQVSIKVDDGKVKTAGGADVLATADAGSDGTFTAPVDLSTAGAAHAEALKSGTHNVRLLSSAVAGARSIHVDFTVQAPPGGGGGGQAGGGGDAGAGGSGAGAGGGGDAAPGGGGTGAAAGGAPAPAVPVAIASTALRAAGAGVAVRLRGGSARTTGALTLRTAGGVALARALRCTVPVHAARTVHLTLTRAGRAYLRRHRRVVVRLRLAPAEQGKVIVKSLTLKVA